MHMKCFACDFSPCPNRGSWCRIGVPEQGEGLQAMVDVATAPTALMRELSTTTCKLNLQIIPIFAPDVASAGQFGQRPFKTGDAVVFPDGVFSENGTPLCGEIGAVSDCAGLFASVMTASGDKRQVEICDLKRPDKALVLRNRAKWFGLSTHVYDVLAQEAPPPNWAYTALLHAGVGNGTVTVDLSYDDFQMALKFQTYCNTGMLKSKGWTDMPPLGLRMLSAEIATVGLSVTHVAKKSTAAAAGISPGYVVTAVNQTSLCGKSAVVAAHCIFEHILTNSATTTGVGQLVLTVHPSVQCFRGARFEPRLLPNSSLYTTSTLTTLMRAREVADNAVCAIMVDATRGDGVLAVVGHLDSDKTLLPDSKATMDSNEWLCAVRYSARKTNQERVRVIVLREGVRHDNIAKALQGVAVAVVTAIESSLLCEQVRRALDAVAT